VARLTSAGIAIAQEQEPRFEKHRLSDVFFCEGANFGDFDGDGVNDVVSGPYWYRGPQFTERNEREEPKASDPLHYSNNFFAWPWDFNADGKLDVFFVGFPGK